MTGSRSAQKAGDQSSRGTVESLRVVVGARDGTEYVAVAGDVTSLPSGHDAWVIGDEDVVVVDWFGASHYAQPSEARAS